MRGLGTALLALTAWSAAAAETLTVTGAATTAEPIPPEAQATLIVSLHEAEARGPGALGAEVASVALPVRAGRTAFALEAPREALVFGSDYALAAVLRVEDGPSLHAAPVRLRPDGGGEEAVGEITLRAGLPPLALAPVFRCDDGLEARVGGIDGAAVLEIGGARFAAAPERTASGARTGAIDAPGTFLWAKGGEAIVALDGEERVGCRAVAAAPPAPAAATLAGAEWVVEDVDGRGVVDASRVTLAFDGEGGLAGRGGCNAYVARYAANGPPEAGAFRAAGPETAMTLMACAEALERQERRFLELLARVRAWRIDATGALVLTAGDGARILARR